MLCIEIFEGVRPLDETGLSEIFCSVCAWLLVASLLRWKCDWRYDTLSYVGKDLICSRTLLGVGILVEWCCTCKGAWELVSQFVLHCCGFEKLGLPLCILGLLGWCLGQWRQSFIAGIKDFQGEVKERGWMWCMCALSDHLGERECRSLADLKAPFPTLKGVAIVSLFFWLRHHFFGDWLNHWISCFRWRWCVLLVTFVYFIWPCMVPSHWRLDNITAFSFEKIAVLSGTWAVGLMGFLWLLQVRIQLGQGSATEVTRNMLKNGGIGAFYKVCFLLTDWCFCSDLTFASLSLSIAVRLKLR